MAANPSRPSTLSEAFHADFKRAQREIGLSARAVNIAFGHSPESSWAYQVLHGDCSINVQQLLDWNALTGGVEVLRLIAERAGYSLTPLTAPDGVELCVPAAGMSTSAAISAVYKSLENGIIEADELPQCLNLIDDGRARFDELRAAVIAKAAHDKQHGSNIRSLREAQQRANDKEGA